MKQRTFKRSILQILLGFIFALTMVFAVMPSITNSSSKNNVTAYAETTPTPLTLTAQEANATISFSWDFAKYVQIKASSTAVTVKGTPVESTDWVYYNAGDTIVLPNVGDSVAFKGEGVTTFSSDHFEIDGGKVAASGDVTSLTNGVGGNADLTSACYVYMFYGCTSLTTAPNLPSKTLSDGCYTYMFFNCTSLTTVPELPATTMAHSCYGSMFYNCTSLTSVPELQATQLAPYCYSGMFQGCTGLKVVETTDATKANWIFPTTDANGWNNSMISGLNVNGTLTAVEAGKMYIACAVAPVTGVELDKTTATISIGNTETLVATIAPENASDSTVSWESDNTEVATVEDGVVTALKAGTATITVKTTDGDFTATCVVTVEKLTVSNIAELIEVTNPSNLTYDATAKTATVVAKSTVNGLGVISVSYKQNGAVAETKNVGEYDIYITVAEGDNYNAVTETKVGSFTIVKAQITKPVADTTSYTYTGAEQTYTVATNEAYTVTGNKLTNAGYQTVTVALTDTNNYEWADGTTDNVTFTFTIAKADPTYTVPTDLTAYVGNTLADVTLPTGFAWVDATASVGEVGENVFNAIFTPNDTANYNTVENIQVTVSVAEVPAQGEDKQPLSTGVIVAISVSSAVVVLGGAYVACYFLLYRKGLLAGKKIAKIFSIFSK